MFVNSSLARAPQTGQDDIEKRVAEAYSRAQALGSRVLLRLHTRLAIHDPWLHLATLDLEKEPYFAWHDGRSDLRFAALGPSVISTLR